MLPIDSALLRLDDRANNNYDVHSHVLVHNGTNHKRIARSRKVTATSTQMQDLESHETSGLLNKQSSTSETQPQRRAVALTIVVALVATTALVNLVPSGRGGLRATRLEVGAAAYDGPRSPGSSWAGERLIWPRPCRPSRT